MVDPDLQIKGGGGGGGTGVSKNFFWPQFGLRIIGGNPGPPGPSPGSTTGQFVTPPLLSPQNDPAQKFQ